MRFETCNTFIQCKIGDFANIKSGRDQKTVACENGNYPIYGTGGIFGKANNYVYNKPTVCIGRKGTIDRPFYIDTPFWCVDTLFYSEINENILPKYVFYLFQTINWKYYDQSTGVPSLTSSVIESIKVVIPEKTEQEKIAKFLTLIDERIATQNKIIDKLESLIKGIRAICFNSKNINFVRLGQIAEIYQPETISQNQFNIDGDYLVFGANGVIGRYNKYNHETEQICITCRGSTCGNVILSTAKSWITGNAMVVNVDKNNVVSKYYLYQQLLNMKFDSIISGSGQPQITRQPLSNIIVALGQKDEQIKIEKIFKCLESKVAIEKDMLSTLQKQKAYLLKNMFI